MIVSYRKAGNTGRCQLRPLVLCHNATVALIGKKNVVVHFQARPADATWPELVEARMSVEEAEALLASLASAIKWARE